MISDLHDACTRASMCYSVRTDYTETIYFNYPFNMPIDTVLIIPFSTHPNPAGKCFTQVLALGGVQYWVPSPSISVW